MIIRSGFVSNSSSTSFLIKVDRDKLNKFQVETIYDHTKYCEESEEWFVYEEDGCVCCSIYAMDGGFPMYDYLLEIGVKEDDIKRE